MGQQPLFGLKSRVTHEERAQHSVLHEYNQRIFIDIIGAVGELCPARREKRQCHLVIDPTLMTSRHNNRYAMHSCFRIFAINVRASFDLLKLAVPKLRGNGRIIAFSTPYVVQAQPDRTAISASKAALQAMLLGLSKEVGARGITVNVVIPGATDTSGFADAVPKEALPQILE